MTTSTKQLLQEALNHLYLHIENREHMPGPDLYARIERHLNARHSGGVAAQAAPNVPGEQPSQQTVAITYCPECGGAKYPWIEYHHDDCVRQYPQS